MELVAGSDLTGSVSFFNGQTYLGAATIANGVASLTTNATLETINPILASSFAFLNLAYSLVAEFFSTKKQTPEELAQEADRLEALAEQQSRLDPRGPTRERSRAPADQVLRARSATSDGSHRRGDRHLPSGTERPPSGPALIPGEHGCL